MKFLVKGIINSTRSVDKKSRIVIPPWCFNHFFGRMLRLSFIEEGLLLVYKPDFYCEVCGGIHLESDGWGLLTVLPPCPSTRQTVPTNFPSQAS